jgi:hypothetical protein
MRGQAAPDSREFKLEDTGMANAWNVSLDLWVYCIQVLEQVVQHGGMDRELSVSEVVCG